MRWRNVYSHRLRDSNDSQPREACSDFQKRSSKGGTSGVPRHTKLTRYRCSLPGLAGFAGDRFTEAEVPSIGSGAEIFSQDCVAKFITALRTVKASWNTTEGFFEGKNEWGLTLSGGSCVQLLLLLLRVMKRHSSGFKSLGL